MPTSSFSFFFFPQCFIYNRVAQYNILLSWWGEKKIEVLSLRCAEADWKVVGLRGSQTKRKKKEI